MPRYPPKKQKTIEIDLDLDELDATSAELKATYQEIKDYVLKEFGLKVSSLYISQVKRKCGIEVGENYNLPKSEKCKSSTMPERERRCYQGCPEILCDDLGTSLISRRNNT